MSDRYSETEFSGHRKHDWRSFPPAPSGRPNFSSRTWSSSSTETAMAAPPSRPAVRLHPPPPQTCDNSWPPPRRYDGGTAFAPSWHRNPAGTRGGGDVGADRGRFRADECGRWAGDSDRGGDADGGGRGTDRNRHGSVPPSAHARKRARDGEDRSWDRRWCPHGAPAVKRSPASGRDGEEATEGRCAGCGYRAKYCHCSNKVTAIAGSASGAPTSNAGPKRISVVFPCDAPMMKPPSVTRRAHSSSVSTKNKYSTFPNTKQPQKDHTSRTAGHFRPPPPIQRHAQALDIPARPTGMQPPAASATPSGRAGTFPRPALAPSAQRPVTSLVQEPEQTQARAQIQARAQAQMQARSMAQMQAHSRTGGGSTGEVLPARADGNGASLLDARLPVQTAPDTNPPGIHVVFCIDASGSMKKKDIATAKKETKKTRWDAVFTCASDFVREQNNIKDDAMERNVKFSLILFNDAATVEFEGKDPSRALNCMEHVRKNKLPRLGTNFSAAWKMIHDISSRDSSCNSDNLMVVFLSDGRPAHLNNRPKCGSNWIDVEMAREQRLMTDKNKKKHTNHTGLTYIKKLVREHKAVTDGGSGSSKTGAMSLNFICIHKDGEPWMRELADRYEGTFYMPSLSLDNTKGARVSNTLPTDHDSNDDALTGEDANRATELQENAVVEEEETELQFLVSKSAETLRAERFKMAQARQSIIHLADDTSTMQDTFRSISTALTTMRRPTSRKVLQERHSSILLQSALGRGQPANEKKSMYPATIMEFDKYHTKFIAPPIKMRKDCVVKISDMPFAQGGLRNVFHMRKVGAPLALVAKESRHIVAYADRLRFHLETYKCHIRAMKMAKSFNKKLKNSNIGIDGPACPKILYLKPVIYRLKDKESSGGFRYLAVEEKLTGVYEKFNSNNGYVKTVSDKSKRVLTEVAQSFSHFSHVFSQGEEIVVDIQGIGFKYTDPQIHSLSLEYGTADRGERGMKDFFRTHICNSYCKSLGLAIDAQDAQDVINLIDD